MATIAFLGLGNMGGPMAANLVAAGHTVRGFDPVPALKAAAEAKGAKVFDSGAEAVADADVVITSLPNGDIVKACYAEVLPAAKPGALFIDTSTISVDDARTINAQAVEQGFAQIDAPGVRRCQGRDGGHAGVHGRRHRRRRRAGHDRCWNPWRARSFTAAARATVRPPSCATTWCSPCSRSPIGEAFVLAEKLGLSAQSLFDVITGATGNCWSVHTNCPVPGPVPTSPANNDFKPGFATALMNKDLGLAMAAVTRRVRRRRWARHAAEIYATFATRTNADKDFSAVIDAATRQLSGSARPPLACSRRQSVTRSPS